MLDEGAVSFAEFQLSDKPLIPLEYKGFVFEEPLRLDVYVDKCLVMEAKAVDQNLPIHKAQLLSYMKLVNAPLGL